MQFALNRRSERMRATEDAPRGPLRVLERRHPFTETVERGGWVGAWAKINSAEFGDDLVGAFVGDGAAAE